MKLREVNKVFYLSGTEEELDFPWLSDIDNKPNEKYFILNSYTKEKFLEIPAKTISTLPSALVEEILTFNSINVEDSSYNLEALPGITYKDYQIIAINKMLKYTKQALFLGTGTGKTIIALGYIASRKPESVLIVTKCKVVKQFKDEIKKFIPDTKTIISVTNYEKLDRLYGNTYDVIMFDESQKAKNYSSSTNNYCRILSEKAKNCYLFTGTPLDKHRHDVLSQLAILDSRVMPVKTRTINRYFNLDDYFNPKSEKKDFKKELTQVINDYSYALSTEEALPNITKENNFIITCNKPTDYDKLNKDYVLSYNKYDYEVGKNKIASCVADNKAVLLIKLRELCNGFLKCNYYDSSPVKESIIIKTCNNKENVFSKLLDKLNACIVYYEFTEDLEVLSSVLTKNHPDKTFGILNGKTKNLSVIDDFKQGNINYLLIQSKSGDAGLDLSNVNNIIFYSLPTSHIVFTQCKGRIRRLNQELDCNYFYLICKDTVEEDIYKSLKKKKSYTTRLFNNIKGE